MIIVDLLRNLFDYWWLRSVYFGRIDTRFWVGVYVPSPDKYGKFYLFDWILT